jgi:ribonucleoside-diphosphate reductase alpha chain
MFHKMEIAYNSEEGVELGKKIIAFIQEASEEESMRLAKERGVFPDLQVVNGNKWAKK